MTRYYKELKLENPCLLDTAISGRAISTISIDLYKKFGEKMPELVVIVDKEGRKLKKQYKGWLIGLKQKRKANLIPIKRILSEDRGAALLGIVGVIYPILALETENYLNFEPLAAVSWHILPKRSKDERIQQYNSTFNLFRKSLREAIKIEYETERCGRVSEREKAKRRLEGFTRTLTKRIHNLIENLRNYELLNYPDPNINTRLFTPYTVEKWEETSAHVIHLYFDEQLTRRFVNEFARRMKIECPIQS